MTQTFSFKKKTFLFIPAGIGPLSFEMTALYFFLTTAPFLLALLWLVLFVSQEV